MIKEFCFKVRGRIRNDNPAIDEDFSIFINAIDDRHAVLKVKEYLWKNAPSVDGKMLGRIIVEGVSKKVFS